MPTGGAARDGRDRLLLRRGREGLERARRAARAARGAVLVLALLALLVVAIVLLRARRWTPGGAAAARPPAQLGPDPLRLGADVREAAAALPRHRPPADPDLDRDHRCCRRSCSTASASSASTTTARPPARLVLLAVAIGTALTLLGLGLVQAATACALVEHRRGPADRAARARTGWRSRRTRPLLGSVAIVAVVWRCLTWTVFLIPVAIWLAVRWALRRARWSSSRALRAVDALHRSAQLVRGHWLKVGVARRRRRRARDRRRAVRRRAADPADRLRRSRC